MSWLQIHFASISVKTMIIFREYLFTFGWAIVGAISMAVALAVMLKVFNWLTPIKEWDLVKEGNVAVAIILSSAIISTAIVIGNVVS